MNIRLKKVQKTAIKRKEHEPVVQPNLACSPKQIADMAKKGIAISSHSVDLNYHDGETDISFDVPVDQQANVDIAEIWEAQQIAQEKVVRVNRKFKVKTNRHE